MHRTRAALRILLTWLLTTIGALIVNGLLPELDISSFGKALAFAAFLGILNAVVWPLVVRFAVRAIVWTVGLFALVVNGALFWFAAWLVDSNGVPIGTAILGSIMLTAITTIVSALLAIDDDDSFQRNVIRRYAKRNHTLIESDIPGVFFLEIDGLSMQTLLTALRGGYMPNLDRWLQSGSHKLVPWESDLSSQTGAAQAGLLLGHNTGIPAFRWYEKDTKRTVVSSSPKDAAELEARLSDGAGLLAVGGASRGNLVSGDAPITLATLSTVRNGERISGEMYGYFSHPYGFARTLLLFFADIGLELKSQFQQKRNKVEPRLGSKRLGTYPFLRAATTVVLRDVNVATLISDMMQGVPVAYSTFVGYDEVAHHSGIERSDTMAVLRRLDHQFERIARAAEYAPRPYEFVILSDHGQSQGATFKQRFGTSLDDLVKLAVGEDATVGALDSEDERVAELTSAVSSVAASSGAGAKAISKLIPTDPTDGSVEIAEAKLSKQQRKELDSGDTPDLLVMASGNLGLIYLLEGNERLTLEQITELHPRLIDTLRTHRGIGFLMVRSAEHGAVVIGGNGVHYLADDRIDGEDPLAPFGPNAADHLRRNDSFDHMPDILVNSFYDPLTQDACAFEELIGFHGGLGGPQSHPFALAPSGWPVPEKSIIGAEHMHLVMRDWLKHVGQEVADPKPKLTEAQGATAE